MEALDIYDSEQPLIVSSGVETSIKDVVKIITDQFGFKNKVVFDDSKPDGQLRKPSDVEPFRRLFPNYKFTPIRVGIKYTIKWFLRCYPLLRGAVPMVCDNDPYLQTR